MLSRKYSHFPQAYKDEVLPGTAIVDIEKLEALTINNTLEMLFYQPSLVPIVLILINIVDYGSIFNISTFKFTHSML